VDIEQKRTQKGTSNSPTAARGTTQTGVRLYNERLVLSLIRQYGQVPKAELARLTGLSAQTVSVIVRLLEKDGLVIKGNVQRGKVGQPLTPFRLNPDGAFSIGLKVGRRSGDLILLDLSGKVRKIVRQPYHFPSPSEFLVFAKNGIAKLLADLPLSLRKRISGLGIAAPFELWNWEEEVGAPREVLDAWRGFDLMSEVAKICDFPVHPCNDATAACAAELFFGNGHTYRDFAYFYIGFFIGGGVVLNGALFQGRTGYSGAMGPIPVPGAKGPEQLIRHASTYKLERMLAAEGRDPLILSNNLDDWSMVGPALDAWIEGTSRSLAYASLVAASVIEFEAVIIDGAIPSDVRQRIVAGTKAKLQELDQRGIAPLQITEGHMGVDARAMGAASLPLFANFIIDRDVLFKEALNA
jgi:predicted NBD/HSP70 family sugar kinase/biotin operon repressor